VSFDVRTLHDLLSIYLPSTVNSFFNVLSSRFSFLKIKGNNNVTEEHFFKSQQLHIKNWSVSILSFMLDGIAVLQTRVAGLEKCL